jgi:hypothetical protein
MNHPPPRPSALEGLTCFIDRQRLCGPDCMAWSARPEGPDYKDQQWANCQVLVAGHRGGKHLVVLASQAGELLRVFKNGAADQARANQAPPPKVK